MASSGKRLDGRPHRYVAHPSPLPRLALKSHMKGLAVSEIHSLAKRDPNQGPLGRCKSGTLNGASPSSLESSPPRETRTSISIWTNKTHHSVDFAPPKCRYMSDFPEDGIVPRVCSAMGPVDEGEVCQFSSIGQYARANGEGVEFTLNR